MTDDELEEILGSDLFNELNTLGDDFINTPFLAVDDRTLDAISNILFEIVIPFQGDLGIELVTAVHHMKTSRCEECEEFLWQFLLALLGHMWTQMLATVRDE